MRLRSRARLAYPVPAVLVLLLGLVPRARAQTSVPPATGSLEVPPPSVEAGPPAPPMPPPADATVLFDGRDLVRWRAPDGSPARWMVADGYVEVVPGTGDIVSADSFGDVQLHLEWCAPPAAPADAVERGSSDVALFDRYRVRILGSGRDPSAPADLAGAISGERPPLVDASRPPGEWQSFDIVFHRPRIDAAGRLLRPGRMTVLLNGILVQDDAVLPPWEPTGTAPAARPPDRLPLRLQENGSPIRFRDIWVRPLPDAGPAPATPPPPRPPPSRRRPPPRA